ncbi:MAG: outer membrane beta-barrel protein, partial [Bacteroidia bacterium]|nr:outer membrane beta-barrel protein [Bacteroidia bacterium]
IVFFYSALLFSQESDGYGVNLPRFYRQKLHFGFTIAGNSTDFRINPVPNSAMPDTIIESSRYDVKTIYSKPAKGFAIGLVADARLFEYVRLRLTPNISFGTRRIQYRFETPDRDSAKVFEKTVESVFLIFPMEVKIQSKRQANFSAYVIGGGGYTLDLSARKKAGGASNAGPNQLDDNVKLLRDDFFYSAGAGVDFYLQYFKLGFELKLLIGTKNLLKKENSVFTNSIDKVRSRMVVFSITFEG